MLTDAQYTQAEELAAEFGRQHGATAASWIVDGNTSDDTARRIVQLDAEGDPAWFDLFGPSQGWLSGEHAGEPTPRSLEQEIRDALDFDGDIEPSELDEFCDAYEAAADAAYVETVVRDAAQMLPEG